jgi:hypothetical protein
VREQARVTPGPTIHDWRKTLVAGDLVKLRRGGVDGNPSLIKYQFAGQSKTPLRIPGWPAIFPSECAVIINSVGKEVTVLWSQIVPLGRTKDVKRESPL